MGLGGRVGRGWRLVRETSGTGRVGGGYKEAFVWAVSTVSGQSPTGVQQSPGDADGTDLRSILGILETQHYRRLLLIWHSAHRSGSSVIR